MTRKPQRICFGEINFPVTGFFRIFASTKLLEFRLRKFAALALFAALATPAMGADLSSPSDDPDPGPVPRPRWEGFYLGYNRGFGGGVVDNGVSFLSTPTTPGFVAVNTNRASGFIAGGQAGYALQFRNGFVLGLEGDFQWSDIKSSFQGERIANTPGLFTNVDAVTGINWFGTVRGRVGYSLGRLLPYVTGGLAYASLTSRGAPLLGSNVLAIGSNTGTTTGWAMGAGTEFSLSRNLSARTEYLFMSLPGVGGAASGVLLPTSTAIAGASGSYPFGTHIIRGGLNYRFTGMPGGEGLAEYEPLLKGDLARFLDAMPARDWSGLYAGVNAGYGGDVFAQKGVLFAPASASRPAVGLATYASDRTGGFVGGAQLGYNYQFYKHFVLGVETDAQWSGITGQHESVAVERPYSIVSLDTRVGLDWFGTTRVRAGFARGDSLSYVSVGAAYGQVSVSGVDYAGGAFSSGLSAVRAGWSIGTGTEYAITSDLALRADYLYLSMGGVSGPTTGVLADLTPAAGAFSSTRVTNNVLRVGLNWKIGPQLFASPVSGR